MFVQVLLVLRDIVLGSGMAVNMRAVVVDNHGRDVVHSVVVGVFMANIKVTIDWRRRIGQDAATTEVQR